MRAGTHRSQHGSLPGALCKDERGASLIEFAFVSPAVIALLIAVFVTMLVFFAQQCLETAGEAASRYILTGQAQSAGWSQAQFQTQTCNNLPSFMSCSRLMIDVQTASSFGAVNTSSPTITYDKNGNPTNKWSYQLGKAGDIVILRLMYIWPTPTGPLGFNLSNTSSGNRLLVATSVGQTEPYS